MKRHPTFQDLSRDHFVALNRCLQVVRAVEGHPAARPLGHAVAQLRDLWEHDGLQAHFREEESDLVPVLRQRGAPDLADRMVREHAELARGLGGLDPSAPQEALAAARGLTAHARWEEDVVFEWLQKTLGEGELAALLVKSQTFRKANGLPVDPPRP